ncbi:MAG: topoisomerase C-terminal repeat-containing protein, partial [Pseudomonadota bacterium]
VYREDRDDPSDDDEGGGRLPPLAQGDAIKLDDKSEGGPLKPERHETQPPPRYTEASLIKKLEELGIGRPSTYTSILQTLKDREYVKLEKKRFEPEDRGRLVTTFLSEFFPRYVQYDFTAELETQLDLVSDGKLDWKALLEQFWKDFSAAVGATKDLTITNVLDALDEALGPHLFPDEAARTCPQCNVGRLSIKLGKFGAFVGCSNYPDCRFTRPFGGDQDGEEGGDDGPKLLGQDPETGLDVSLRKGPYGRYVQLGPAEGSSEKPKRQGLPKTITPADVDLAVALRLLALPRQVGDHPETGKRIEAGIGRYGPYLKHDGAFTTLKEDDPTEIGLNRAVVLLAEAAEKKGARGGGGEPVGDHPEDGKPITLHSGRYGPYVKHGKVMASLPKGEEPSGLTVARAAELLAAKAAKGGGPKTKAKAAAKPKAASKTKAKAPAKPRTKRAAG